MMPHKWQDMYDDIARCYDQYDGFIVIMGTDTMAYAASAASFAFAPLDKAIIFTGSLIPFAEVYTDARRNIIVSLIFAGCVGFHEVFIFFNDKLLRANRTTKLDSSSLEAFVSPNFPPLATLGYSMKVEWNLLQPPPRVRRSLFVFNQSSSGLGTMISSLRRESFVCGSTLALTTCGWAT